MILVTVGTEQYPFNSLMSWIDLLIRYELIDREEEVVVQYGASLNLPDKVRIFKRLPESEFKNLLEQARVVISHCGEGSAMLLESLGKPYVLVPRIQRFGEHVDNHQLDLAIAMEKQGIPIARCPGDLVRFLASPKAAKLTSHNEEKLCKFLSDSYNEQYKKIMVICSSGGHFTYAQSLMPFIEQFQDMCWVTFNTATTEAQIKTDKQRKYWAYSPTNRNLPNLIRNLILAFKVLNHERPDVVLSTGAGVAVPFLILAKFLYRKKTVFIESKTRINKLSLSAQILKFGFALDKLIVRNEALKKLDNRTEYIDIDANKKLLETSLGNNPNILKVKNTGFLKAPSHLSSVNIPQFKEDFRALCELQPKKIVADLSSTVFISSGGLGALINSLKLANSFKIKLILWSVNPAVMSVLTMAKLNKAFRIEAATLAVRPQDKIISQPELEIDASVTSLSQRTIDIAAAIPALCITAILLIPIGILIKLDSPGAIFCVQSRYGRMGKLFRMRTFRSRSTKALAKDQLTPSPTKIGYFLRKTNLDKLPLFWNVLMGDMSLVGPRASRVDELDWNSTEEWNVLQVKPGISSEWKVNYDISERCCQSSTSVTRSLLD